MKNLYLGTQGWSYPSWVGTFYPEGTPNSAWLDAYAVEFTTVELDTTFYAVPRASTVASWRERTPEDFRFAAKFPQSITHEKQLVDCRDETTAFVKAMSGLGEKLGPLLLQMPPAFAASKLDHLSIYLEELPSGLQYAVELRHRSWLSKETLPRLLALLHAHDAAICLVQHAWMPRLDEVTASFTYMRWLGRRSDIPDDDFGHVRINRDAQLDSWSAQVSRYLAAGVTVYGYFNNHYQGHSPASVRALQARLPIE